MPPLVTLAVATLNRPSYLRVTLAAALAQDYPNLEIVVSDNGSTDSTPQVIAALVGTDPRVRTRSNQKPVPIQEHFTQCLRSARGEYFILLCDDDLINPRFVSELVAVAMRHPEVNVVLPANNTINEAGELLEEYDRSSVEVVDGPALVCDWLYGTGPRRFANVVSVLTRTKLAQDYDGYTDLAGGRNTDNLLFLKCAITSPIGIAPLAIFSWRTYAKSFGNSVTAEQLLASGNKFVEHLERDPLTVQALSALAPATRRKIVDGVRRITANELLSYIRSVDNVFSFRSLRRMLKLRGDAIFVRSMLRYYYHWSRESLRHTLTRTERRRLASGESASKASSPRKPGSPPSGGATVPESQRSSS